MNLLAFFIAFGPWGRALAAGTPAGSEVYHVSAAEIVANSPTYKEFLDAIFSKSSTNQEAEFVILNTLVGDRRLVQSGGPSLLGFGDRLRIPQVFRYGFRFVWAAGVVFAVPDLLQTPFTLPEWLFGYPFALQSVIYLFVSPPRKTVKEAAQNLAKKAQLPTTNTTTGRWLQIESIADQSLLSSILNFDILERIVLKHFSNGHAERFGGQIERILFQYISEDPVALRGWLFRYLQVISAPDGSVASPPWRKAFEDHLRIHVRWWKTQLEELRWQVGDATLIPALAGLIERSRTWTSLPARFRLKNRQRCEYMLQWFQDFR
jgi:hypothetical protein